MLLFKHLDIVNKDNSPVKITIASGPVIIHENKVLLDKHDDPFWKFPGGSVQDDESFHVTAIREAKEELGLVVKLSDDPFIVAFDREYKGLKEYVVLIHYLASIGDMNVTPGKDVTAWEWFDVNNLPQDVAPNVKSVVEHFIK